jgi:hypothetical protein
MHVLHEDIRADLRALDFGPEVERRTMAAVGDLREEVNRRLDPLEATVRELTKRRRAR